MSIFCIAGWSHAVTVLYPLPADGDAEALAAGEARLSARRNELHRRLGAPPLCHAFSLSLGNPFRHIGTAISIRTRTASLV